MGEMQDPSDNHRRPEMLNGGWVLAIVGAIGLAWTVAWFFAGYAAGRP
jgi:hypothetical protein